IRVVEHKLSNKLYALKCIVKARCIKQKAVANILQERRLLEEACRGCFACTLNSQTTSFIDRPPFCGSKLSSNVKLLMDAELQVSNKCKGCIGEPRFTHK
ncbi:hypothetical protein CY34DRAFT_93672, partial [Suillus luteus UH-Slu-Lm8-n1]